MKYTLDFFLHFTDLYKRYCYFRLGFLGLVLLQVVFVLLATSKPLGQERERNLDLRCL